MNNIIKTLEVFDAEKCKHQLLERRADLLKSIMDREVYIWGTGRLGVFAGEQLKKIGVQVNGFIDNDPIKRNKTTFSPTILSPNDIVVIASKYYAEIGEQLRGKGIENFIHYEELAYLIEGLSTWGMAYKNIFGEIENNKDKYISFYNQLKDDISKIIFLDMLCFKMTFDYKYSLHAREMSLKEGIQDFDTVIIEHLNKNTFFLDVGGFDGATSLDFLKINHGNGHIFFFEPDPQNLLVAKENLSAFSNITFVNAGAGQFDGVANFDMTGGDSSCISRLGNVKINVVTLGKYINTSNVYVKMDIEGGEEDALLGMGQEISEFKPMLGISVYHKPDDFHKLSEIILSRNRDYKLYLRHYDTGIADTVCYYI